MCFIYFVIIIMLLKLNSELHANLPLKKQQKNKKIKCHKINTNFQGVQMFSNINGLISKAKTLFATKDFDSRAHI